MTFKLIALLISICFIGLSGCQGQPDKPPVRQPVATNKPVGGVCDGCELLFVGLPAIINSVDTSAGWYEGGQKLVVTGTVYKPDGKTPAPDVILYYWHTDRNGYYAATDQQTGPARRHGHIRGWIQTDAEGKYTLYTSRPAPYPNRDLPAHIHIAVKEPTIDTEYYLDEFVFDDDPLLTTTKRKALENRGGSGVLRVLLDGDRQIAEHTIVLGLNIPHYPQAVKAAKQSGLSIGEASPSFTPFHAFGPDKGTKTCPVCKYGRHHGLLYFVGNNPDWPEIKAWLRFLEAASSQRPTYRKAYFIYGNEKKYDPA
ncbi:dioxygenase family protein [Spirosoma koreense]